jgi:hypothetical protein
MTNTGRSSGFPHETAPGRFVPDELCTNDLESHRAPQVGIDRLVGYSHTAVSEFHRCAIFVFENLVVLKTELRRNLRKRLGLRRDSSPQRANRTEITVLAQCSAANLARAFAFCFHDSRSWVSSRDSSRFGGGWPAQNTRRSQLTQCSASTCLRFQSFLMRLCPD